MTITTRRIMFPLAAVLASCPLLAAKPVETSVRPPGVVSHVKVLSDKVEDVSSLEAWKQSFIKPGMTDEQKAEAVWRTVVMFRHQEIPPNEFLDDEGHPHDPIKDFNVYGYGQCCCASANVEALARYAGLEARGWGITGHSVPEINVGGNWCMFDASLVNYFTKPDGSVAGVEEVGEEHRRLVRQHPEFKGNDDKLMKFMRAGRLEERPAAPGRRHRLRRQRLAPRRHPRLVQHHAGVRQPAKNFVYEYGMRRRLRGQRPAPPRRETRPQLVQQGPARQHARRPGSDVLKESPADPHGQMRYAPRFGDLTPGRVGNGTLEYDLPLAGGAFRDGMLQADNLADARDACPGRPSMSRTPPTRRRSSSACPAATSTSAASWISRRSSGPADRSASASPTTMAWTGRRSPRSTRPASRQPRRKRWTSSRSSTAATTTG